MTDTSTSWHKGDKVIVKAEVVRDVKYGEKMVRIETELSHAPVWVLINEVTKDDR